MVIIAVSAIEHCARTGSSGRLERGNCPKVCIHALRKTAAQLSIFADVTTIYLFVCPADPLCSQFQGPRKPLNRQLPYIINLYRIVNNFTTYNARKKPSDLRTGERTCCVMNCDMSCLTSGWRMMKGPNAAVILEHPKRWGGAGLLKTMETQTINA